MIVVTGPGRSGTSLVASIYRELGFETGGEWIAETNAGWEDWDVVVANSRIISDLRCSVMTNRSADEKIRRSVTGEVEGQPLRRVRSAVQTMTRRALGQREPALELVPWARFDEIVEKHAPDLRALARQHAVVKDPRFCWTIGAWAQAGAEIDHVLVCVRNVRAMVQSRLRANHILFQDATEAMNAFIYGMGVCMASLHDYRIPYDIVQFPDFLEWPDELYRKMRFPREVSRAEFDGALAAVRRDELVHDRS